MRELLERALLERALLERALWLQEPARKERSQVAPVLTALPGWRPQPKPERRRQARAAIRAQRERDKQGFPRGPRDGFPSSYPLLLLQIRAQPDPTLWQVQVVSWRQT